MHRGYVKLWRKSLDAGWLKNPKLWTFWCWCLMKASHKEYDQIINCQTIHLAPGDFIFGLKSASKELKMSIQSTRTILFFLEQNKNLMRKTTNKFSIISIINWYNYQSEENPTNKQLTNKQQTTNKQLTTNKNDKNDKNKEYSVDFLSFYNFYPNKKAPREAWKVWNKIPKRPPIETILEAIKKQIKWRKNANGEFRPEWKHPATWLNKGCWEDEIKEGKNWQTF